MTQGFDLRRHEITRNMVPIIFNFLLSDDLSLGYFDEHLLWNPLANTQHLLLIQTVSFPGLSRFPSPLPDCWTSSSSPEHLPIQKQPLRRAGTQGKTPSASQTSLHTVPG